MGILAPTDLRQWPSEGEYMPLLRSLADRAARVAINMALLTELFAAPAAPLRHVTDAYKEQGLTTQGDSFAELEAMVAEAVGGCFEPKQRPKRIRLHRG
jgi:hypothetical protein